MVMNKLNQICTELRAVAADRTMNACATTEDVIHDSERFLNAFRSAIFPGMFGPSSVEKSVRETAYFLQKLCSDILSCDSEQADCIADSFLARLPRLSKMLRLDLQAAYDGDPAAKSLEEVLLAYPGFEAIMTYRAAHELYALNLPLLPRLLTESAHKRTGIDIHPGAQIGESFFIDHGTGVVIGETCVIGNSVKLYQGVTLGAKSFPKDANGNPVKGNKRHPNIGNNVVIYAGATILGGDTYVGDNSIIGGNVWLTHSVENGSRVYRES